MRVAGAAYIKPSVSRAARRIYVDAQAVLSRFRDTERQNGPGGGAVRRPRWMSCAPAGWTTSNRWAKPRPGSYVLTQVRHLLGHYTVEQLTDARLQDYQTRRGVSAGSIRRELGGLSTVLRWAAKKKLIAAVSVPEFELPAAAGPRVKFLDRDQEQWFWDQAMAWGTSHRAHTPLESSRRVALFVALGLETAARRGAIYDLTWDRVDLAQGTIDYRVPGRRVTKKRRVLVPISDRLAPVLEAAWLEAPKDVDGRATGRVLGVYRVPAAGVLGDVPHAGGGVGDAACSAAHLGLFGGDERCVACGTSPRCWVTRSPRWRRTICT